MKTQTLIAASALSFATMATAAGGYGEPPPPAYGKTTTSSIPPASFPTPVPTTSSSSSEACPTLCIDYVNECGQMYGGCFADCPGVPRPTFEDPGCPTTTTSVPGVITSDPPGVTPVPLPSPISEPCTNYLCVDSINSCGQTYGGCYYDCPGSTTPVFTDPGCPTTTSDSTPYGIVTTTSEPIFTILPIVITTTTSEPIFSILPIGCGTICDTRTDACGNTYGPGCYTSCSPADVEPTFSTPACNLESTPTPASY